MLNVPKNKRKIPIFYHIPKNAGTYILSYCINIFRYYRRNSTSWNSLYNSTTVSTIKTINLIKENLIVARIIVGDPNLFIDNNLNIFNINSKNEFELEYNKLNVDLIENLFIFSIIIESRGFEHHTQILNFFKSFDLQKIIILRDPFSRSQSLYNYLTSHISDHERDQLKINISSFDDYIKSSYLEDSWLIRNLLNISNEVGLEKEHFIKACDILNSFKIYDIKNVKKSMYDAYMSCYNINIDDIKIHDDSIFLSNKNNYKKIKFEELSLDSQQIFKDRTYLDNKIYERFCNKE